MLQPALSASPPCLYFRLFSPDKERANKRNLSWQKRSDTLQIEPPQEGRVPFGSLPSQREVPPCGQQLFV